MSCIHTTIDGCRTFLAAYLASLVQIGEFFFTDLPHSDGNVKTSIACVDGMVMRHELALSYKLSWTFLLELTKA